MSKLDEIVDMLQNSGLDLALSDDFKKESDHIKAKANYAKHYKQQIKALMLELIGPHESLSEQQVKDGRIYILGDPQADAVDRYRDDLAKKVEEL